MEYEYSFQFTTSAKRDLDIILSYFIVELQNKDAANEFIETLNRKIDSLRMFPKSGALVENLFLGNVVLRRKIVNQYNLIYFEDEENHEIIILRIIHAKVDLKKILLKFSN